MNEIAETAAAVATVFVGDQDRLVGVENSILLIIGYPERLELTSALNRADDIPLGDEILGRQVETRARSHCIWKPTRPLPGATSTSTLSRSATS